MKNNVERFTHRKIFKLKEDLSTGLWNSSGVDICGPELCFNGLISEYQSSILSFGEDDNGKVQHVAHLTCWFATKFIPVDAIND